MKIENGYLIFEKIDYIKNKKITATNITALLGENKFKKKGDALLSIFGLYKETIDPFYTERGAIAEKILQHKLKNEGYEIKIWDKYEINFDNFPKNINYGGMLDIAIVSPYRCVVECKSKNISKLNETKKFQNKDYEMQAKFYGYMSKCEKVKLIYVFFTDEQELKIRNSQKIDIENEKFEIYGYDLSFDNNEIEKSLELCREYKTKCYNERKIPIEDISDKVLDYILGGRK